MKPILRLFFVVAFIAFGWSANAQTAQVAFGGLKHDSSLPVEITADNLRVDQENGNAVFDGNVVVGQGEMRLTAARVVVEYGTKDGESTGKIDRMHATGGVTLVNGLEAAEAKEAVYVVSEGVVDMTGDVILTQDKNVLSSDTMHIDLETGVGTMEGRVRSVLLPDSE